VTNFDWLSSHRWHYPWRSICVIRTRPHFKSVSGSFSPSAWTRNTVNRSEENTDNAEAKMAPALEAVPSHLKSLGLGSLCGGWTRQWMVRYWLQWQTHQGMPTSHKFRQRCKFCLSSTPLVYYFPVTSPSGATARVPSVRENRGFASKLIDHGKNPKIAENF